MKGRLVLALLLAGCVPETPPANGEMTAVEVETCRAGGGRIGATLLGNTCFQPTPDAGKQCTKKTDCSTICLGETGTCAPETPTVGCFEMLDETGTRIGICVD